MGAGLHFWRGHTGSTGRSYNPTVLVTTRMVLTLGFASLAVGEGSTVRTS